MNKDLLCEGKFPDQGAHLFGDGFGFKAKTTADNIKALKGLKPKFNNPSYSNHFPGSGGPNKGNLPLGRRGNWGKGAS